MDPQTARTIIHGASTELREAGVSFVGLSGLENHKILEIVGRWPPDGMLPVPKKEAHMILGTIELAQVHLAEARPHAVELSGLNDLAASLRAHIDFAAAGGSWR
jgi:hypothetical protein